MKGVLLCFATILGAACASAEIPHAQPEIRTRLATTDVSIREKRAPLLLGKLGLGLAAAGGLGLAGAAVGKVALLGGALGAGAIGLGAAKFAGGGFGGYGYGGYGRGYGYGGPSVIHHHYPSVRHVEHVYDDSYGGHGGYGGDGYGYSYGGYGYGDGYGDDYW